MLIEKMFESPYVIAADFIDAKTKKLITPTLKVSRVVKEKIIKKNPEDKDEVMAFMYFEKAKKPLGLNRTNAEAMALVTGSRDSDDWIGKLVTLGVRNDGFPIKGTKDKEQAVRIIGSPALKERLTKTVRRGRKTLFIEVGPTKETGAALAEPPKVEAKTERMDGQHDAPFQAEPPPLESMDPTKPTPEELAAGSEK